MLILIQDDMVMNRTRCSLKSNMRVQKKVPIMRAGNVFFDQRTRKRVSIPVSRVAVTGPRERPEMMAFVGNNHGEFSFPLILSQLHKDGFHTEDFIIENVLELPS